MGDLTKCSLYSLYYIYDREWFDSYCYRYVLKYIYFIYHVIMVTQMLIIMLATDDTSMAMGWAALTMLMIWPIL